nr:translation initiation factor IF-2-like [Taeniopygia guttata]
MTRPAAAASPLPLRRTGAAAAAAAAAPRPVPLLIVRAPAAGWAPAACGPREPGGASPAAAGRRRARRWGAPVPVPASSPAPRGPLPPSPGRPGAASPEGLPGAGRERPRRGSGESRGAPGPRDAPGLRNVAALVDVQGTLGAREPQRIRGAQRMDETVLGELLGEHKTDSHVCVMRELQRLPGTGKPRQGKGSCL